jgi:cytochrome c553
MYYSNISFFLLLSIALFSGNVLSEEDKYASVRDTLQTCFVCHGENGASTQGTFPILAGQEFYYLYVQLKDMKSGLRASPIMSPLVAGMEKADLRLMAEYFAEQKWSKTDYKMDKSQVTTARKAIDAGQCLACHLDGFRGSSRVPRLANQHVEYLNQTMLDFKNNIRKNSPSIATLFSTFNEDEIKAMSIYLGAFKK